MIRRQSAKGEWIPAEGQWPVTPQDDVDVDHARIWIDGCFDFSHHGHAGAMLQARQLGTELLVGVHSDEAILENKGPTVMRLDERIMAVEACRWATKAIPKAPYVTSLPWITHYGCWFVVHGDDITSDASGEDCYRYVKAAGRFKVVKRTPGISTTDLVGRMLLYSKGHHIRSLDKVLAGDEGSGDDAERKSTGEAMMQRIRDYATDATGLAPGCDVWYWHASSAVKLRRTTTSTPTPTAPVRPGAVERRSTHSHHHAVKEEKGTFSRLIEGKGAKPGQRVVYVDGGWDLFSSGHIAFLRQVTTAEEEAAKEAGWYAEERRQERIHKTGEDYGPLFLVAGIHDDDVINHWKLSNYPIMNIFERGLCVLQCKYVHAVVFGAPFSLSKAFLRTIPYGSPTEPPAAVYHGITAFMPLDYDPYAAAKSLKIYREIDNHDFQNVNAAEIVERIMKGRAMYEERQRKKGVKGITEEAEKRRQSMEREAERERSRREVERQFGL
ncbi:hypothetical protein EJ04DRAFT_463091 [Polyplosphaeria fusca]|uniref:ethanolamine-phosphate cytidylyltransferase n=1 Tax=Polyplosphaeria fusca TaxID=682080 RepID=A0A9P4V4I8_9PLEO|nr:hypothetical protein EJ04DRAFT_463091 [Polyplosphaeria fusca]